MARTRKQALSPSSYPSARLVEWLRRQSNTVTHYKQHIVLGSVVVVVCAIFGISWAAWAQYRQSQGLEHFRVGLLAIESKEYAVAVAELAQAEAALQGERRGVAALHLGEAFEKSNQLLEAKDTYERIATSHAAGAYVKQIALLRLGHGAEEAEEFDTAAQWYREASGLDGPSKSEALLALGEALERQEGATVPQAYFDLLEQFPDSPFADMVRTKTGK
jgi:tetratricopeptide (TPR) repeat protein